TNHWGRHVPRFGPYDFKPKSRDGLGVDWPISYDDVAPYMDRTERLIGVCGANIHMENHPDSSPGILQPPPTPRVPELLVQAASKKLGIPCVPSRRAILTRDMPHPHAPRSACYYASPCGRGCNIGAAFQTTTSLLPMALATGKLRVITNAMVHQVRTNAQGQATGVAYFDTRDHSEHTVTARAVVLGASACETARILLNSKQGGLGNSSGQLGKNLLDTIGVNIHGQIPALEGRPSFPGGSTRSSTPASSISRAAIISNSAAASARRARGSGLKAKRTATAPSSRKMRAAITAPALASRCAEKWSPMTIAIANSIPK
ncbi:MAG: GMC family oxidoreductase N-terminal domain-containing protein, partial [Pseudomonadota bacterium]